MREIGEIVKTVVWLWPLAGPYDWHHFTVTVVATPSYNQEKGKKKEAVISHSPSVGKL